MKSSKFRSGDYAYCIKDVTVSYDCDLNLIINHDDIDIVNSDTHRFYSGKWYKIGEIKYSSVNVGLEYFDILIGDTPYRFWFQDFVNYSSFNSFIIEQIKSLNCIFINDYFISSVDYMNLYGSIEDDDVLLEFKKNFDFDFYVRKYYYEGCRLYCHSELFDLDNLEWYDISSGLNNGDFEKVVKRLKRFKVGKYYKVAKVIQNDDFFKIYLHDDVLEEYVYCFILGRKDFVSDFWNSSKPQIFNYFWNEIELKREKLKMLNK